MIFISHSSRNNDQAVLVRDWLVRQGWGLSQIYLDLDNLNAGERWRRTLNHVNSNCEAVVVCLSDDWIRSPECLREFNFAEAAGKPIFPVIVESLTEKIPSFVRDLQFASIADPASRDSGFARLRSGLLAARIGPQYFPWPPASDPARNVYRGLGALDEVDAAIFFGRDSAILSGLDRVRQMRVGTPERALIIVGASGSGKSSFLRAGLLPRLRRESHHFLVLPVIRPQRAAVSGSFGLQASLSEAIGSQVDLATGSTALAVVFAELRAKAIDQARQLHLNHAFQEKPPTIVIPIDQAEELYTGEKAETEHFVELLATALAADANAIALFTVRSDSCEVLQLDRRFVGIPHLLFSLPLVAPGAFKEIIEGPARLSRPPIEVERALVDELLHDLDTSDAMPLLAFTLERLSLQSGGRTTMTLTDYRERLGGLKGAITSAVDAALGPGRDDATLSLAKRVFIPELVQIDADGARRRVAALTDFSPDVLPLMERFVAQRLLVRDRRLRGEKMVDTVEVAHEALLRQWPQLSAWIDEERDALRERELLVSAAREWKAKEGWESDDWLAHRGYRRVDAEKLIERPDFQSLWTKDVLDYLAACTELDRRGPAFNGDWFLQRKKLGTLIMDILCPYCGTFDEWIPKDEYPPEECRSCGYPKKHSDEVRQLLERYLGKQQ